jgi:hypothetical protein
MDDLNEELNTRRITAENIEAVATWCGGHVSQPFGQNPMIKVSQYDIALIGDYVVKGSGGIAVFSEKNYLGFPKKARRDPDKYSEILKLVVKAMLEQDSATYHQSQKDMGAVAQEIAMKILELD